MLWSNYIRIKMDIEALVSRFEDIEDQLAGRSMTAVSVYGSTAGVVSDGPQLLV